MYDNVVFFFGLVLVGKEVAMTMAMEAVFPSRFERSERDDKKLELN